MCSLNKKVFTVDTATFPAFYDKNICDSVSPSVRTKITVISLVCSTSGDNGRLFSDGSNFISISGCIFYKHRRMCFIFYWYLFTHSVNTCIHRATWTFLGEHTEHFAHVNTTVDDLGAFLSGGKSVTAQRLLGNSFLLPSFW